MEETEEYNFREEEKSSSTTDSATNKCLIFQLIPAKIAYFFTYCFFGSYKPYIVVFLISTGLSASKAGLIFGICQLASFLSLPLWGVLIDRTGKRLLFTFVMLVGIASTLFPAPWIAARFKCDHYIVGNVSSNDSRNSEKSPSSTVCLQSDSSRTLFFAMLVVFTASSVCEQPFLSFLDSVVTRIVSLHKSKISFGQQRVFGSIGYAVAGMVTGLAADNFKHSKLSPYSAVFFVFLPFLIVSIPFVVSLVRKATFKNESKEQKGTKILIKTVFRICCKLDNFVFLLTVLVKGSMSGLMDSFVFVFMEKEMDAAKSIMGISIAIACFSEVLVFPFASPIIKKLQGAVPCVIIGLFSISIRFVFFSVVRNPWFILPCQLSHALDFALFWAASIEQTKRISPKEVLTTMFAILNSLHFALASLISSIAGGYLYDAFGGRMLFRGAGIVGFVWCLVAILYYYILKRLLLRQSRSDDLTVKEMLNRNSDL
ncbi:major facilitator superfamily domain-containing protein 6-like [Hydractinia symbiolongicarpus]|uniref:major facilitator superfamily domain-containing protein 6-like n=1 Tax=Hydractinia symbiolongicarpus TaxID=13093 RepID=UPI00254AFF93|nr:major facilitator superfamily domain-containing protein 6-like [Hydractinia symbiolongicarpus]